MGFFSDLKDDLSQAVSELMPEEQVTEEQKVEATAEEFGDLNELLERVDSIEIPELVATEEPVIETPKQEIVEEVVEEVVTEKNDLEEMLEDAFREQEKVETTKPIGKVAEMIDARIASDETSLITGGMTINGDVESEGSINLTGCINGNITVLGKLNITGSINGDSKAAEVYAESAKIIGEVVSEGAVKVGSSSVIIGNITANSAVIAGAVKGDIDVHGPVILDNSAIVMGNIKSKSVQINNGAVIEGKCSQCYADVNPTSFFEDYKTDIKKSKK